jgi:DNA-binding NtrC family response regulator
LKKQINRQSLVLYIGTDNLDDAELFIAKHPELQLGAISNISEYPVFIEKQTPDLIVLEKTNDIKNIASTMAYIQRECNVPIIIIAAATEIDAVIVALRSGAYNFVSTPITEVPFINAIFDALRMRVVWNEIHETQTVKLTSMGQLIGSAPCMQVLYQTIRNVSASDASVFIQGPSGTGKELVAKAIHENSPRHKQPFIAINCGAIPPNLLESELFGHERGAFTGATSRRTGKFEQADKGTLFLDEIAELPLDLQVKLLRITQDMKIVRVGGKETIPVDVRIICATNRNIKEEVKSNRFREDLYYRLNVVPIKTPPLTERRDDIPLLMAHFLSVFSEKYNKFFFEFSPEAMRHLCSYDWPGNVREMENMIERIVVLHDNSTVEQRYLPEEVVNVPIKPEVLRIPQVPSSSPPPVKQNTNGVQPLWQLEMNEIAKALNETDGNVIKASKLLEIGQATLYRKIKKYHITAKSDENS